MEAAVRRSARPAGSVTLIAVTKTVPPDRIAAAYRAGVRDFGESYVQEALGKIGAPGLDQPGIRWHFIGHLQRNKVRQAVPRFWLLHGVDSVGLAQEISRVAGRIGVQARVLLEVKPEPSVTRFGFAPDDVHSAGAAISALPAISLEGIMGIAPYNSDPEAARPAFRLLNESLYLLPARCRSILSMGMSADYETAIEEGATHVRIGTAIFGLREPAVGDKETSS